MPDNPSELIMPKLRSVLISCGLVLIVVLLAGAATFLVEYWKARQLFKAASSFQVGETLKIQ